MGLGLAVIPAVITALLGAATYGISWVAFYAFNAAPMFGSMVINYIAVIILAFWAVIVAIYTVVTGMATVAVALE
jgi:hypothetical protein